MYISSSVCPLKSGENCVCLVKLGKNCVCSAKSGENCVRSHYNLCSVIYYSGFLSAFCHGGTPLQLSWEGVKWKFKKKEAYKPATFRQAAWLTEDWLSWLGSYLSMKLVVMKMMRASAEATPSSALRSPLNVSRPIPWYIAGSERKVWNGLVTSTECKCVPYSKRMVLLPSLNVNMYHTQNKALHSYPVSFLRQTQN